MRLILKAVVSIGLSSIVTLLLSILRMKLVAVELGAEGIGVLGIVTTSVLLASTALGGGLGASGVRAVASAPSGGVERAGIHAAVARGSAVLALLAAVLVGLVWSLWGGSIVPQVPSEVLAPWVAISVGATIGAAGTSAILNGQGRIHALATSTALGSAIGTLVFLVAMQVSDRWAMIAAFAAVPVATVVVAFSLARSTYPREVRVPHRAWTPHLGGLLKLGLVFSGSVVLTAATQVTARVWVSSQLGIASAGYVQGCFTIGSAYLGFLLTALAAEYYPRISALHGERGPSNRAVNDQMRVVLNLGGPVIVCTIVAAPWLLRLLYSAEFESASTLLRLLLIGDVFKLVGWCVGFLMLAREAKGKFFAAELSWNVVFLAILIPLAHRGVAIAGVAYVVSYVLYSILSLALARRETGFRLSPESRRAVLGLSLFVVVAFAGAESRSGFGLFIALVTAAVCAATAATRLVAWTRRDSFEPAESDTALGSSWFRRESTRRRARQALRL